jgi:L-fuconolactonase
MNQRAEWLQLTREEAIDPDLPICDPHHHLWDYPGSRYLLDEFLQDIGGGHRVLSTVFVECLQFYGKGDVEELRPVGETEFIHGLAGTHETGQGKTEVAAGIVGFADLSLGSAVYPVLNAHLEASDRFRGVRHASAWDSSEKIHNAHTRPPAGLLESAGFREGIACLEKLGLSFDAWLFHPQIPELVSLAQAFPGLKIVLNHMAGPLGIGPYAENREVVFALWRDNMKTLAECSNVFVKLGGRSMSLAGFGWHKMAQPPGSEQLAEAMGPYVHSCIDLFGPGRCMFESNFPVDRASCSYTILWNAFKRLSRDYETDQRNDLLSRTAMKFYRLGTA